MIKKTGILFIVVLAQCTTNTNDELVANNYFNIVSFTNKLIQNQANANLVVIVKSEVNGLKEEVQKNETDSSFWATELVALLEADINKPSLVGAYKIEEQVTEANSNLLKTVYSALPTTKYKVKKIEIKYLGKPKEIRQIAGVIESNNSVYVTHQYFHIWLNRRDEKLLIDSISTSGFNKTIFLDSMVYSTVLNVL